MYPKRTPEETKILFEEFVKYGIDALEGRTRIELKRMRTYLKEQIEPLARTEAMLRMYNPNSKKISVVYLDLYRHRLVALNKILTPTTTSETVKHHPEKSQTGIEDFRQTAAALYLAYTGRDAGTTLKAKNYLNLFKTVNSASKLREAYNKVRGEGMRVKHIDSLSETQKENFRRRIEQVMDYLNEDEKGAAERDLEHINGSYY